MIFDANNSEFSFHGQYDFCVVGAGPAGITLALELAKSGVRIALLEGGDREITSESQDVYQGEILGAEYTDLDVSRLRYLGGTTGHWGGQCIRLDDRDFEARDDVPLSGWPITYEDLRPYEEAANKILNLTSFGRIRRPLDENLEIITDRWSSDRAFYDIKNTEPIRFGSRSLADLEAEKRIDLVLNANATGVLVDAATGRISEVKVENYSGQKRLVRADHFILAMGGIENSRFLLQLNSEQNNQFGNQGDMVGRCFMVHPNQHNGFYFITKRLYSHSRYWELERFLRRQKPAKIIGPTSQFQLSAGILNGAVHLDRLYRKPLNDRAIEGSEFVKKLEFDKDYFFTGVSYTVAEQAPNPASRILLVEERDRFGNKRAGLDLRYLPIDIETMRTTTVEVARMLIRSGLGRMQMRPELWEQHEIQEYEYGGHHMGGARMSTTSDTGVVDKNCRVHGAKNLYVAGCGVFATSSHANPTYSIVTMALRLADHLRKLS